MSRHKNRVRKLMLKTHVFISANDLKTGAEGQWKDLLNEGINPDKYKDDIKKLEESRNKLKEADFYNLFGELKETNPELAKVYFYDFLLREVKKYPQGMFMDKTKAFATAIKIEAQRYRRTLKNND